MVNMLLFRNNSDDKLRTIFKNPIEIKDAKNEFIGGFKAIIENGDVSYNYTIDNLIHKNDSLLQKEFSLNISDLQIKECERKFEEIIQEKRNI